MRLLLSRDSIIFGYFAVFLCVYFVMPKSFVIHAGGDFREFSYYLGPWFKQRYLLMGLCLLFFVFAFFINKVDFDVKFLMALMLFILFGAFSTLNSEYTYIYAYSGVLGAYAVCKVVRDDMVVARFWLNLYAMLMLFYVFQFLIYDAGGRHVSSFLDPNISGYYLFLTYSFFRYAGYKFFAVFSLVVGLLGLSRNFYLAVFLFEIFFYIVARGWVPAKSLLRSPFLLFFSTSIVVVAASYYVVNSGDISETIGGGTDRLTNVMDGSNYARSHANTDMISRMLDGDFLYVGSGSEYDGKTDHRPHNAYFRAVYRYGFLIASLVFLCSLFMMKTIARLTWPILVGVFTYYSILNDFVSGPEFSLLFIVSFISYLGFKSKLEQNSDESVN